VIRQGLAITAAGLGVGLCIAALLARSVATLLYLVTPYDPMTFVLVPIVLLAVAAAACAAPARRAARMDPLQVLRSS
jgi:ABC-type antimicrobial peptide transport system permease subunit